MRPEGKGYVLKEYGSWSVLLVAFLTGLVVVREFPLAALPVLFSLGLLINSKQAFMKWLRQSTVQKHLVVFLAQIALAGIVLVLVYFEGIVTLLPLLALPAAYLAVNRIAGEHFVVTELLGFALLSLAAVLAKFLVVQGVDVRLFAATALYFTSGVFKVKAVLFRKVRDRILSVLYILFAAVIYRRFQISLFVLLPLAENVVMAVAPYNKVRLQTTGWIEVAKSLAFLTLMGLYF